MVRSREKILRAPESLVPAGVKQSLLLLLGGLAGRVIADKDFVRIRDMGDNVFFDLIQEEAMDKGLQKGRLEGMEKGIVKGIEKGIEKGRAEEARRAVLRVLARRFGAVPDALRARVEAVEALEHLERLHDEAIACPGLDTFRRLLDPS